MTRKKPAIRARPIRGVLTSDAEYTEQLRQWHIEAMFTLLVADGFSSSDLKALSDHPETKANFWFETALHFAGKCHSRLKLPPLRNVVWHQGKLHDLMADFWFEERRLPRQRARNHRATCGDAGIRHALGQLHQRHAA